MFKRLFVLLLLTVATASASTPARASTLAVTSLYCRIYAYSGYNGYYRCTASVSGGTGSYVSYTWDVTSTRGDYSVVTSSNTVERTCFTGTAPEHQEYFYVTVTVRDSAGATASTYTGWMGCGGSVD